MTWVTVARVVITLGAALAFALTGYPYLAFFTLLLVPLRDTKGDDR